MRVEQRCPVVLLGLGRRGRVAATADEAQVPVSNWYLPR